MYADDDAVPYRVVRPTETVFPVAGAIAFFLGIPQPFSHKASTKSHVKLLTLSKDDYEDIKDRFPESRDQLIENIKAMVGLKGDGALRCRCLSCAWTDGVRDGMHRLHHHPIIYRPTSNPHPHQTPTPTHDTQTATCWCRRARRRWWWARA